MAFGDGRVQFVSDSLDDQVYAQIMTTKHKRSKYYNVDTGVSDRNLPQPTESDL